MRVGILECDHVDARHRGIAGDYTDMFATLLAAPLGDAELVAYDVRNGSLPASPDACDAWVATGSRASVYDEAGWIDDVARFVREVRTVGAPYVGVCFGHQLLAHALGGRTERAPGGWGAGARRVEVVAREPWMAPAAGALNLLFMHQDQVTEVPAGASVLARATHCPVAMLRVGDAMLGIQAHPEFSAAFVDALLAEREERIGSEAAAAARRSLVEPTDEGVIAGWVAGFLRAAADRRRPRTSR